VNRAAFIGRCGRTNISEHSSAELVRGDGVESAVLHENGYVVHGVDQLQHVGVDLPRTRRATTTAGVGALVGGSDEVVEVGVFAFVEGSAPPQPRPHSPGSSPRAKTSAPIPGTRRVARVEENTAADGIELTADQLQRLDNLMPAAGDRHDEVNMASIDR
jgi:hypothetical protein